MRLNISQLLSSFPLYPFPISPTLPFPGGFWYSSAHLSFWASTAGLYRLGSLSLVAVLYFLRLGHLVSLPFIEERSRQNEGLGVWYFLVSPVGQEGVDIRGRAERKEAETHTASRAGNPAFNLGPFTRAQKRLPVVMEQRAWEWERKRWQGVGLVIHPSLPTLA